MKEKLILHAVRRRGSELWELLNISARFLFGHGNSQSSENAIPL
jgi:hypothetical protein